MTDVAELCAGIGGLGLAVAAVWPDTRLVWTAEQDRHARTILTRHWPDAQHHGRFDEAGIDGGPAWHELDPPDILTAGFPCQDISYAGLGAGIHGTRSSVFFHVARAVRVLRPRWVVLENVGALRSRGLDVVTHTLAGCGYVGSWCSVRASDIGAPHRRERVFIVATAHPEGRGGTHAPDNGAKPSLHERHARRRGVADGATADTCRARCQGPDHPRQPGQPQRDRPAAPDTDRDGRERLPQPHSEQDEQAPDDQHRHDTHRRGLDLWGAYWPAVNRWEHATGERAPDPLVNRRLNPDLPRWMMGYPPGWVDGIPKTAQLRCIGNAVCPQQGAEGIRRCLELLEAA